MGDDDAVVVFQNHLFDRVEGAGPGKGNHGGAQQVLVHVVAVVEAADPVALEALVALASTQEAPHVLVELVGSAVPGLHFEGVDAEPDAVQVLEDRHGQGVAVAVQVAREKGHPGAVELVEFRLGHEAGFEEVGPGLDCARVLEALSGHGGPEDFGLLVVDCCAGTSYGYFVVGDCQAVGRWCFAADGDEGLDTLEDAMVDFANAELVQQLAGRGELSVSLGEVEAVGDVNFCRGQGIDVA